MQDTDIKNPLMETPQGVSQDTADFLQQQSDMFSNYIAKQQVQQQQENNVHQAENNLTDYIVAGENAYEPTRGKQLEVTPASLAAYEKQGITPAQIQAGINLARSQGLSEEEIIQKYWKTAKEFDPSLLTPEEDEAAAQKEYYEIANNIENNLHQEVLYFPEDTPYRYRVNKEKERLPNLLKINKIIQAEHGAHTRGRLGALTTAFVTGSTLGANKYLRSEEQLEIEKKQAEMYPVSTALGYAASFLPLTAGKVPLSLMGVSWKLAGQATAKITKEMLPFWKTLIESGGRAAAVGTADTIMDVNKSTAEYLHQTEEERALDSAYADDHYLRNYVYALGGELVGGTLGFVFKPIGSAIRTTKTANELFALQGRQDALAYLKQTQGNDKATLELIKGIEEGNIETIQKIIATNPKLAATIAQKANTWITLARGTINKELTPLYRSVSTELLESVSMPQRAKQVLEGKPVSLNTSEDGIMALVGERTEETFNAYDKALERGQAKMGNINARGKLLKLWSNNPDSDAPGLLQGLNQNNIEKELQPLTDQITPTTFPGFKNSPEYIMAKKEAQDAAQRQLSIGVEPDMNSLLTEAYQKGQLKYFNRITTQTGTDNIYDIKKLKDMIDTGIKAKTINAGEGTAWGRFRKGLNNEILDQADPVLAEIHNIDKVKATLSDAYQKAKVLTPANLSGLEDSLMKSGAKLKPARIAATKMALLDSYKTAAINGDRQAVMEVNNIIQSPEMKKYMSKGEWGSLTKAVQPEIKAIEYITSFSAAAMRQKKQDLTSAFSKLGMDIMLERQAAAINEIVMTSGKAKYNSGVAKRLQEWLTNPEKNWTQFNKIIEQTTDFTEKVKLSQIMGQATQLALQGTGD